MSTVGTRPHRSAVEDAEHLLPLPRLPGQHVQEAPSSGPGQGLTQDQWSQRLHHDLHRRWLTAWSHHFLMAPEAVQTRPQSGKRTWKTWGSLLFSAQQRLELEIVKTSHLLYRLGHILQSWPPARKHSERWLADGCTSCEPHPADKGATVAMLRTTATKGATVHFGSAVRPQVNEPTCSRLRARRVFPVYTSRRCCSRETRKSPGGRRGSTSTRRGSDALERPTLIPPTRPPT